MTGRTCSRHETSPYLLQHRDNPVALAALGRRAALQGRKTQQPARSCSRSAMPPVTGAMSWPMRAFEDGEIGRR